jgi:AAA15 family ATPase/GTPase
MFSVEITNFKSLKNIKFEFDGFTTIVGRNFIGKSNVLQAINAAYTNQSGSDFISWGENFCEVHIITEGLDLLWHKEEGNNFYVINKKTYKKIGKEDIPKELKDLGYGYIKLDEDSKLNLMFSRQFDDLFLVNKKDSKTLDLLTAVYGLDRLYKSIELCNKDQNNNAGMLRIRKKDVELLEKDMVRFDGFDKVLEKREALKTEKLNLESEDMSILELKRLLEFHFELSASVKQLEGIETVSIPDIAEVADLSVDLENITELHDVYQNTSTQLTNLEPVINIEVPSEDPFISESLIKIKEIKDLNNAFAIASDELLKSGKVNLIKMPELAEPDFSGLDSLKEIYDNALAIKKETKDLIESIEATNNELKSTEEILEKEFKGICPLCGNQLTGDACNLLSL